MMPMPPPVGPPPPMPMAPRYNRCNHLLHLILTILTLGLWVVVWVMMALGVALSNHYKGREYRRLYAEWEHRRWAWEQAQRR